MKYGGEEDPGTAGSGEVSNVNNVSLAFLFPGLILGQVLLM